MKLFYSLALLLMLNSLQQVSSIPDAWLRFNQSDPDSGFSGDNFLNLNQNSSEFNFTSIFNQTNFAINSTIPPFVTNISELFTAVMPEEFLDLLNNYTNIQNETFPPSNSSSTTLSPEIFNFTDNTDMNVTTAAPTQPANFTQAPPKNGTNTTLSTTTVSFTVGNGSNVTTPNVTRTTVPKTTTTTTTTTTMTMTTTISETTSEQFPEWPFDTTTSSNQTWDELNRDSFNIDSGATREKSKSQAWGVFLGFLVVVGLVVLAIYAIKKRRSYRDFSHRKLVEEPVLRLDNPEPDFKYGGSAYYNPGVQGDSIQMTNFPQGQYNC